MYVLYLHAKMFLARASLSVSLFSHMQINRGSHNVCKMNMFFHQLFNHFFFHKCWHLSTFDCIPCKMVHNWQINIFSYLILLRRDLGLKSHPKDWRSPDRTRDPWFAGSLTARPRRLLHILFILNAVTPANIYVK